MAYADITFRDRSPIKRWLQQRRLTDAIRLSAHLRDIHTVLDFGAGNGELSKHLIRAFPQACIMCYEPAAELMAEARKNTEGLRQITWLADIGTVSAESVDLLYCLEVFEHLPERETEAAFAAIESVLRTGGIAVMGVPVEIHLPALYKGLFRMLRRFGDFDALPGPILQAALGFPPRQRPIQEIALGWSYHFHHLGFDHRRFRDLLQMRRLTLLQQSTSPIAALGAWLNPEIYFVVRKGNAVPERE